jgi:cytochrome c peroxidase
MRSSLLFLLLAACAGLEPIPPSTPDTLDAMERARVDLGHRLFFDPGLSRDGTIACSTCHDPAHHGAEPHATSTGIGGVVGGRNAPSVFNAALKDLQFWDGRASSLEEQALGPIYAEAEMGQTPAGLTAYVAEVYADELAVAFPGEDDVPAAVAQALAAYERLLPQPTRVDRYLAGEDVLTAAERRGLRTFRSRCAWCHGGPAFGGERLEALGRAEPWPEDEPDRGRLAVTGESADDLVFLVPSLRNVARTAPYLHDGSVATLEEAVRTMDRHMVRADLSEAQIADLVAFLGALDTEFVPSWAFAP